MKRRISLVSLLALLLVIAMLAGCTPKPSVYEGPKDLRTTSTGRNTYNPHMSTGAGTLENVGSMVAMLASKDGSEKLEFVPHHASELPRSADGGTTWTIKFRDDVKWSDGTPVNAKTYYYSMQMCIDPKLANKGAGRLFDNCVVENAKEYFQGKCDWEDVGIKLLDDHTIEMKLQYPASELDFWTSIGTYVQPVHEELYESGMNADRTSTTYGTAFEKLASCGMFNLTEWIIDGSEVHTRNEDDPLVKEGYIKIDTMNVRYVSQSATRSELFFAGEVDSYSLSGDDYLQYKDDPRSHPIKSSNVWGIFVNSESKNKIMSNLDFRLALHYAAPREAVARDVYVRYDPASYIVSTAIFVGDAETGRYYRETDAAEALVEKYNTDTDKAVEHFNTAYADNGSQKITVEFVYFEGQEAMKRTGEVFQETIENLFGQDRIEVKLRAMPPTAAYDAYRVGDYDLGAGVRSANVFNPWVSLNVWTSDYADKYITGFNNAEFDQLYFDCVYGDLLNKPEERLAALTRMEELILEHVGYIPLFQNNNTIMYSDRIELVTKTYLPFVGYGLSQSDINPAE